MKKIFYSLLAVLSSVSLIAQDKQAIEPSGNLITKNVTIEPFDAIEASGLYELVLLEGGKESVKIEADDNVIDLFSVANHHGKLVIEMPHLKDHDINSKKDRQNVKWKVYVTYRKLKSIDVALVGNVTAETPIKSDEFHITSKAVGNIDLQITTNKLNVENKGVGSIKLKGTATDAIILNAGVGKFDGEDLLVQTMDIDNSGVGSADVNVEKNLKIRDSFLGKVRNKGNAKRNNTVGI